MAFFTARLPESRQVDTYVDYIATLRNTEPAALNRAKEAGLDAKAVALKTAARATSAPVAPVRGIPLAGTGQLTADEEVHARPRLSLMLLYLCLVTHNVAHCAALDRCVFLLSSHSLCRSASGRWSG